MNLNICGVNIPKKKNILYGLIKIYGIGLSLSNRICFDLKIDTKKKIIDLKEIEINQLINYIRKLNIENDLKVLNKENLRRIISLNNYKSYRHKKKLPCRGQHTKTNAKTRKKMIHEII